MFFLYSNKPIRCLDCEAHFEPALAARLGLWFFLVIMFLLNFFITKLTEYLGRGWVETLIFVYLGGAFSFLILGSLLEYFRPWFFTLCKNSATARKLINYGCVFSLFFLGIYYVVNLD